MMGGGNGGCHWLVVVVGGQQFMAPVGGSWPAVILHGPAVILRVMTSICSNVHDILHFKHQFFEIFIKCYGIFKVKNTLFSKSAQKIV